MSAPFRQLACLLLGLGSAAVQAQGYAAPAYAAPAYDQQGLQSMAAGDPAQAQSRFMEALEVNPFDPVALNNLAVAKSEQGRFHEATELLERAAKLAPGNTEVAANLARMRNWTQNYALINEQMAVGEDGQPVAAPAVRSERLPPEPPPLWDPRLPASY
ncbi:MAG TPA: tetratricopeptide repeat protein [Nevskiaceae bacterium]|nr:tetratricopeptide repeat protein [Nevskiaceae bacterium]